jgi:glycosyltransferase involved in cell wall biosynthesis
MMEKKKAVVLLVPGFPANEQDTTCLPFLQQFCLSFSLVRPDIELQVISFQYPFISGYYTWNGIKVFCVGGKSQKSNRLFTWFKVFIQLLKIKKKYDLAAINSFWMTECALVGQWFSILFKIKQVVYVIGQDALKSNRYLRLINLPKNGSDMEKMKIIAMSENLVNQFFESTGYTIQHIIPAGIDINKINQTFEIRIIDILGVGSLTPLKNYLLFTEIINELKNAFPGIKACVIGKGEQEELIKDKIKEYKLENSLLLPGELPHKEVFDYMHKSKILLHTSAYEGQSTVIMEALANGLNIVCFDIGRIHVDGKIWVCKNKHEMVIQLKKMLSTPLNHEPAILLTNDDMVREFLKVYEI